MTIINELQLSKDLIRFPSVTPKDAGVIKFLSKKLKKLGFNCKILEFKDKGSKPIKKPLRKNWKKRTKPMLCWPYRRCSSRKFNRLDCKSFQAHH